MRFSAQLPGCAVGHHAAKEKQANRATENNQNNPNK